MFWQSDFFGPFRQTKFFRLMELSHLIWKYEEKSLVKNFRQCVPWDPFQLYCFPDFGTKTFEILFVMVVPSLCVCIL
jgi:hypothetical protein